MASVLRIVDLNGRTINVVKGKDQSWAEVVNRARLPDRFEYCLKHWMSDDPMDTKTEERVKEYLDRVGYLLIQDDPDPKIITDYKEMRDRIVFVPVSANVQLENLFYSCFEENGETSRYALTRESTADMTKAEKRIYSSLTRPRKVPEAITKMQEKRKRIDQVHADFPGAEVTFAVVDTEGVFSYGGRKRRLSGQRQYEPKNVRGEMLYDMDHIACLTYHGVEHFYDQDFVEVTDHVDM